VSQSILDHGYVPEAQAPDPAIGPGNPTPPGKIGIWLFLASEIMFFVALLGTYVVLRAGSADLFARHSAGLSKALAGISTVVLVFSSFTMARAVDAAQKNDSRSVARFLAATILCALTFLGVEAHEYMDLAAHRTIVARGDNAVRPRRPADGAPTARSGVFVYDGHVRQSDSGDITLRGYRMPMPTATDHHGTFDTHLVSEEDVRAAAIKAGQSADEQAYTIPAALVSTEIAYGPSKNIFYASYFILTGVHALHVLAGIIPLLILCVQARRGKLFPAHTEYVGLYWHFVALVWIFLFPLLYLI
jgi:cytochrome c oxidase subunit III